MSADRPENATPLAEITHGPSAFERFLDRNQKLLAVLGILLVIATAAWVVYSGIQKSHQETAGAALQKATDLSAIRKVIDEFPDTPAASSAMILLANAQWDDNQQDTAIQTLRDFISAQPKHPAIATAQASLGSKLMQQGKSADAASAFQAIIDNPTSTYLDGFALISLGDLAKSAGDLDRAETYYQRARTDFPQSGFANTANERLSILRAALPVEVEPPPPPKPVPAAPELEQSTPPTPEAAETPASETADETPAPAPAPAPVEAASPAESAPATEAEPTEP